MKTHYNPFLMAAVLLMLLFSSCTKNFDKKTTAAQASQLSNTVGDASTPNIIFIMSDDVGREIPHYNGGQSYSTPNLDFLAANGMQFPYFFSHPDGPPSRLAWITGKYNYRNWERLGYLAPGEKTFANMLHDAGYATCFCGKWQFDGGDTSIRQHGFDNYIVFMPFNEIVNGHDQYYRRYKNPYLYQDARYLTETEVEGKYSEDMFFDYASKFIDSNASKPFLLVYSHNLVQKPAVPTPDNPLFALWDPAVDDNKNSDTSFFRENVAYMDKIIGKIVTKIQSKGLSNNTIIIFASDNATNTGIYSWYNGKLISGSKDSTTFNGINVPLIVYAPGMVAPGTVDTSLVDMTDFFPTIAEITNQNTNLYQPLDGTTFYDNLTGSITNQRSTVYCYWPIFRKGYTEISYVLDKNYKLYDKAAGGRFYKYSSDIYELNPLKASQLTPDEVLLKKQFRSILKQSSQ